MSVYTLEHTVKSAEVSPYRLLRPAALQELLQEASVAHCEELGVGRARTMDRGILWVLLMQDTHIIRMPAYEEHITVKTWPGMTRHMLFPRFYEVCGADGAPIVRASALWSLIRTDTRRLASAAQFGIEVKEEPDMPAFALPESVCCPETKEVIPFTVPYSFLDINGHMSNVRYFDLAEDHFAQAARGMTPVRIGAEYISELMQGDEISLEAGREGPVCTLQGRSHEKVYFKLRMEYGA